MTLSVLPARSLSLALVAACACSLLATLASAHEARLPVAGKELLLRTDNGADTRQFSLQVWGQENILTGHDPRTNPTGILVLGTGASGGSTGLISLDPGLWSAITEKGGGYQYSDPDGTRGGITSATLRQGQLRVKGLGANWTWNPAGPQDSVWVWAQLDDEWYCAKFGHDTGAEMRVNQAGYVLAANADSPGVCPEQVCGNGQRETGEDCDDGNRVDDDTCSNACVSTCGGEAEFTNTYDAIQDVIFDGYDCSNVLCHGAIGAAETVSTCAPACPTRT